MMMVRGDDDRDESLYTVDDVHVHSHRADAKCGDFKVNAYYIHSPDAKFGMNLLPQVRKPLLHLLCTSRWQTNEMAKDFMTEFAKIKKEVEAKSHTDDGSGPLVVGSGRRRNAQVNTTYTLTLLPTFLPIYLPTFLPPYLLTFLPSYLHSYLPT